MRNIRLECAGLPKEIPTSPNEMRNTRKKQRLKSYQSDGNPGPNWKSCDNVI